MSSVDRLAQLIVKMHQDNVNPPDTSPQVAEVLQANPLKLKWGEGIVITKDKIHLPKWFGAGIPYKTKDRYQDTYGVFHDEEIDQIFKIDLAVGDKVVIIPDINYKKFYLIDLL